MDIRKARKANIAWAVRCESRNALDGSIIHLAGRYYLKPSPQVEGCPVALFKTRTAARKFVADKFGYIRNRADLRGEPHGWKMPTVVRVQVQIAECA